MASLYIVQVTGSSANPAVLISNPPCHVLSDSRDRFGSAGLCFPRCDLAYRLYRLLPVDPIYICPLFSRVEIDLSFCSLQLGRTSWILFSSVFFVTLFIQCCFLLLWCIILLCCWCFGTCKHRDIEVDTTNYKDEEDVTDVHLPSSPKLIQLYEFW